MMLCKSDASLVVSKLFFIHEYSVSITTRLLFGACQKGTCNNLQNASTKKLVSVLNCKQIYFDMTLLYIRIFK